MFKPLLSKIMTEAHARAKLDYADFLANRSVYEPFRTYAYFLGLQMRNGFAEARVTVTGVATVQFAGVGVNERWY